MAIYVWLEITYRLECAKKSQPPTTYIDKLLSWVKTYGIPKTIPDDKVEGISTNYTPCTRWCVCCVFFARAWGRNKYFRRLSNYCCRSASNRKRWRSGRPSYYTLWWWLFLFTLTKFLTDDVHTKICFDTNSSSYATPHNQCVLHLRTKSQATS